VHKPEQRVGRQVRDDTTPCFQDAAHSAIGTRRFACAYVAGAASKYFIRV